MAGENSKVFHKQGGAELVIASGGRLKVETGGTLRPVMTITNLTTAGAETYTAAQLLGGIITRDPNGAGRTDTTDTAANIIAGMDLQNDGETAFCLLINTADAAEAITLAAGSGVTITNVGQTLAVNESATLWITRTSSTAVTILVVGA